MSIYKAAVILVLATVSSQAQLVERAEAAAAPVAGAAHEPPNDFGTGSLSESGAHHHFTYNGETGAQYWHLFNEACGGSIQSPINIESTAIDFATSLKGVLANPNKAYPDITWPTSSGTLKNLGDTLKFTPSAVTGSFNRGPNQVFQLAQWHIHAPSEHRFDGKSYPAEIHFVHLQGSNISVVGAMVEFATESSPLIKSMITTAKDLKKGASAAFNVDYTPIVAAIKESPAFYRYTGSLTTPEGVRWLVASKPVFKVSMDDYKILKAKVKNNARETLPLFDMYDTNWVAKRVSDYFPEGGVAPTASTGGH